MCAKLLIFHWNQDKCPRSYCLIGDFIVILEIRRWIIHVSSRARYANFPRKTLQPFSVELICLYIRKILLNGLKGKPFSNPSQPFRQKIFTKSWIVFPKPLIVFKKCLKFFCYKLCNAYSKLLNIYSKLLNTCYKLCNKNFLIWSEKLSCW